MGQDLDDVQSTQWLYHPPALTDIASITALIRNWKCCRRCVAHEGEIWSFVNGEPERIVMYTIIVTWKHPMSLKQCKKRCDKEHWLRNLYSP